MSLERSQPQPYTEAERSVITESTSNLVRYAQTQEITDVICLDTGARNIGFAFRRGWKQSLPGVVPPTMYFLNPSGLRTREYTEAHIERVWKKYAQPNAKDASADDVRVTLQNPNVTANAIFTLLTPALRWSDHLPDIDPQEVGVFILDTDEQKTNYSLKLPLSGTNENRGLMVDATSHFLSDKVDGASLERELADGYLDQIAIWMLSALKYKERLDTYRLREDAATDLKRSFPNLIKTPGERKLLLLDTTIDTGSSIQIVLDYLADFEFPTPHVGVVSVSAGEEREPYVYNQQAIEPFVALPIPPKTVHGNAFKKSTLVMRSPNSVISEKVGINHYRGLGGETLFQRQRAQEVARLKELREMFS